MGIPCVYGWWGIYAFVCTDTKTCTPAIRLPLRLCLVMFNRAFLCQLLPCGRMLLYKLCLQRSFISKQMPFFLSIVNLISLSHVHWLWHSLFYYWGVIKEINYHFFSCSSSYLLVVVLLNWFESWEHTAMKNSYGLPPECWKFCLSAPATSQELWKLVGFGLLGSQLMIQPHLIFISFHFFIYLN